MSFERIDLKASMMVYYDECRRVQMNNGTERMPMERLNLMGTRYTYSVFPYDYGNVEVM